MLSNTLWPRALHERVFLRDDVLGLIDGAVYSSEIPWTKPHPEAFRAAMAAIGVTDPAVVRVRRRPALRRHLRRGEPGHARRADTEQRGAAYDGAVPDAVITRLSELLRALDKW